MTFADAIRSGFNNYANFNGRARRSAFWYWVLFYFLVALAAQIIDAVIGVGILGFVVWLAFIIPNFAVGARRLHDIGRSGWWQLLVLTFIGVIVLIVWWAQAGDPNPNSHGPSPYADGYGAPGAGGQPPYGGQAPYGQ